MDASVCRRAQLRVKGPHLARERELAKRATSDGGHWTCERVLIGHSGNLIRISDCAVVSRHGDHTAEACKRARLEECGEALDRWPFC